MNESPLIPQKKLPAPRLELRWAPGTEGWGSCTCFYNLVLPLDKYDVRRERTRKKGERIAELTMEIGATQRMGGGGSPLQEWGIATPYRDGAHALWDAKLLGNLPIYAVCEGKAQLVAYRPEQQQKEPA